MRPQAITPMNMGNTFSMSAAENSTAGMIPPNQMVPNKFTGMEADVKNGSQPLLNYEAMQTAVQNNGMSRNNQAIAAMRGQNSANMSALNTAEMKTNQFYDEKIAKVIVNTSGGGSLAALNNNIDRVMADVGASKAMNMKLNEGTLSGKIARGLGMA